MTSQRVPAGIRFKTAGKIYYFDAGGLDRSVGNFVVVETSHGLEIGRVIVAPDQVVASEIKDSLKPILRIADAEDLERSEELKKRAAEQLIIARQRAIDDELEMRIVAADYSLDGSMLSCYFTAPDRVDFRSPSLYYANPGEVVDFCCRELSRYVVLRHDYPLYEHTIYVYREPPVSLLAD